jgi:hypothetical protein
VAFPAGELGEQRHRERGQRGVTEPEASRPAAFHQRGEEARHAGGEQRGAAEVDLHPAPRPVGPGEGHPEDGTGE